MIHIACGCDDGYARYTATMLVSALHRLSPLVQVTIYLLHDEGLSQANLTMLAKVVDYRATLKPLRVAKSMMEGFPTHKFHRACWYRVLLPELLGTKRVIYLDSDMLVVDDIAHLWETKLDNRPLGAVINPLYSFNAEYPVAKLGLQNAADYLNSGCLLIDLEAWRNGDLLSLIRKYAAKNPENAWPEQDALSAVLRGEWMRLHPRWNLQSTFFELRPEALPVSQSIVIESIRNPAIIHFSGGHKPWHYLCKHPWQSEFLRMSVQTPDGEIPIEGKTLWNRFLKPFSLRRQLSLRRLIPPTIQKILDHN